jgi:hypothetical protein
MKSVGDKLSDGIEKLNFSRLAGNTQHEQNAKLVPETKDMLVKPDSWADVKDSVLNGQPLPDFGTLRKLTLSGAELTGEMYKNAAAKWTSQWTQWAQKVGERGIKNTVRPLEHSFYMLDKQDLVNVSKALLAESKHDVRFSPEELTRGGITGKALDAYTKMRQTLDAVYESQKAGHEQLGLEPPTRREAYAAAMRHGDYHVAVTTTDGRPIWYSRFESKVGANKALNWIKENVKRDDIDWNSIKVENRSSNFVRSIPRDVLAEYQELSRMVDKESPASQAVQAAIQKAQEDRGYTYQGQDKRFLNKTGVPGFEGDMPWLSEKENATRLVRAQLDYLENANKWVPMQEALGQLKQMFADPIFSKDHASSASYLREVVNHVIGINKDAVREAERYVSNQLGLGANRFSEITYGLKGLNSFQKLSGSVGYMISTPLQAFNGIGLLAREAGLKSLNPKTNAIALADVTAMLANETSKATIGKVSNAFPELPMTKLGQYVRQYMESNNSNRSIINQHHELGSNPGMNFVKSVLGPTISIPERVARSSTMMVFAHHLADMNYAKGDLLKIMQRAEALTNMVNTNYMRGELPMLFNSAGSASSMWGQFKAPAFNFYNQVHGLARDAAEGVRTKQIGKVLPLVALLGMTAYMAGIKNFPGVQEADGGWNVIKDGIANIYPEYYDKFVGLGIRNAITNNVSSAARNGVVSAVTGADMGSRFSPNIMDVENPFKNMLPAMGPELAEWKGLAKAGFHPMDRKAWEQFVYSAIMNPMGKGLMENNLQDFKTPFENKPGLTGFRKAGDIHDISLDYQRTPEEQSLRNLGLRSIREKETKEQRYAAGQENQRISTAYDNLIEKVADAAGDKDKEKAAYYSQAAMRLIPDQQLFASNLNSYLNKSAMTPEQREATKSNNIRVLQLYLAKQGKGIYDNSRQP